MVFLETEGERLIPLTGNIWYQSSTLPADLPTGINVLLFTRAVSAHAPFLLFRHTAPRVRIAFPDDIPPEGDRGQLDY